MIKAWPCCSAAASRHSAPHPPPSPPTNQHHRPPQPSAPKAPLSQTAPPRTTASCTTPPGRPSSPSARASDLGPRRRTPRPGCGSRTEHTCLRGVCGVRGGECAEGRVCKCAQKSVRRSPPPAQGSVPCSSFSVNMMQDPGSASIRCTGTFAGQSAPRSSSVAQDLRQPSCSGSAGKSGRCDPGIQPKPPWPGATGLSS